MKDLKLRKMFNASKLSEGYGSYMYTLMSMHDNIANSILRALNERKADIKKESCVAFAYIVSTPLNGREKDNIEVSEEDLKYITNQMYICMQRLNRRLIYHDLIIIPKRDMFKINIKTSIEKYDSGMPNSSQDLKIYYHVDIMNPLAMMDSIAINDLDKYFDCFINGFKVRNINIKSLFRSDFKTLSHNIFNTLENEFKHGVEKYLMSEGILALKQRISGSLCVNEYRNTEYFNNINSPINTFAKSEVLENLRTLVSNTGLGRIEVDNRYIHVNINKVDIIPCVSIGENATNITYVIDYTVSDIKDHVNEK